VNRRRWLIEACLAIAVFGGAAWWGTAYWNTSLEAGRQPIFYQEYFEPAVMMACGKGFVIARTQPPALTAFLFRRADRFSCDQIPADAQLGTQGLYQGVWRYLLTATSVAWRMLGISWSGLGPLFGVFFASTIAVGYGIFRLGMGRAMALTGAFALSVSTLHLLNLPHLRDYSKAPFTLALILIIGIVVTRRPTPRVLLGCAAAYGAVLGVGYGFRTDFLVNVPVFLFVLFAFVEGGVRQHLALKSASAALCLAVFMIVAWPVISTVYQKGGCQWHTALLGLTTDFTDALELEPARYDWGAPYLDEFVDRTVTSYGRRMHPGIGHIEFCSHEYDNVSGQYLMEIARRFPADMLTRALASDVHIANLPFPWFDSPLPGFAPRLYATRRAALTALKGTGIVWVVAAIAMTATISARLAFFLGFFVFYFAGYPAIQFSNRHHFHLEFIAWWAFGFVLHHGVTAAVAAARRGQPDPGAPRPQWRQAAWVMSALVAASIVPLLALRGYQQLTLARFFDRYVQAAVDDLPLEPSAPGVMRPVTLTPAADARTGETFLVVTLNAWQCGEKPSVTFRYDKAFPIENFSRTISLSRRSPLPEPTYIFMPVYNHFVGVEFSDVHPGCVGTVARVRDLTPFTLLLPSVLPPRWDREPLYQRFKALPMLSQ
jgi:hypothetical protein